MGGAEGVTEGIKPEPSPGRVGYWESEDRTSHGGSTSEGMALSGRRKAWDHPSWEPRLVIPAKRP